MYKYDAIKLNQNSLEDSIKMLNDYPPPWECFAIDNGVAYFRKLTKPMQGWQLVTIYDDVAYFIKPVPLFDRLAAKDQVVITDEMVFIPADEWIEN